MALPCSLFAQAPSWVALKKGGCGNSHFPSPWGGTLSQKNIVLGGCRGVGSPRVAEGGSEGSDGLSAGWTLGTATGRGDSAWQWVSPSRWVSQRLPWCARPHFPPCSMGMRQLATSLVQSENLQWQSFEVFPGKVPYPPGRCWWACSLPVSDQLLLKGIDFAVITEQAAERAK